MELIADILLVAGALGAGFYCFVLARRLNRFNDLEKGVGGAVAVLSSQVDDLTKTLAAARAVSQDSDNALEDLTSRAETVAQRLELIMASMHDMPGQATMTVEEPAPPTKAQEQKVETAPLAEGIEPASREAEPEHAAAASPGLMFMRHDRNQMGTVG